MYIRLSTSEGVRADPEKEGLQGREAKAAGTTRGRRTPVGDKAASVESAEQSEQPETGGRRRAGVAKLSRFVAPIGPPCTRRSPHTATRPASAETQQQNCPTPPTFTGDYQDGGMRDTRTIQSRPVVGVPIKRTWSRSAKTPLLPAKTLLRTLRWSLELYSCQDQDEGGKRQITRLRGCKASTSMRGQCRCRPWDAMRDSSPRLAVIGPTRIACARCLPRAQCQSAAFRRFR